MPEDRPFCRACVRDGTVTLHRWSRTLLHGGPAAVALEDVPASLADLLVTGDGELIVAPVTRCRLSPADEAALLAWAEHVGYGRVWLPGRVVTLTGGPAATGPAAVRCTTCGARWRDDTTDFWLGVRAAGAFPGTCPACGGSLPEWTVDGAGPGPEPGGAPSVSSGSGRPASSR